jgi:ABC-type enterochelin transport system substrate-binding protein
MTIDPVHLIDSAKRHALTLARLFGKDAEATVRIAKLDAAIGAVRARAATAGAGLIVLTTGGRVSAFDEAPFNASKGGTDLEDIKNGRFSLRLLLGSN